MTMIEKVARAMYPNYDWGLDHGHKDIMHTTARIAIEALRIPTNEMRQAADRAGPTMANMMKIIYEQMIDAALKE